MTRNANTVFLLVTGIRRRDLAVISRICRKYSTIIVIGERESIRIIGEKIRELYTRCIMNLIVFDTNNPEEKALLIYTQYTPKIVYDLDRRNRLYHLKKILEKGGIRIINIKRK